MTREMYGGTYVSPRIETLPSVKKHIIGNIIERYKDNNDSDEYVSDDVDDHLSIAQDGEIINGVKVAQKDDEWYLRFQDGKVDGPYQQIEYDSDYLYCTIIFGLVYRYELNGLLSGVGSQYRYYGYLKQFVEKHKDDYEKFKRANYEMSYNKFLRRKRASLFELDYRRQRLAYMQAVNQSREQKEFSI